MANSLNGGCARDGGNAYIEDDVVIGEQGVYTGTIGGSEVYTGSGSISGGTIGG
jgi:hypothetical protein